MIIAGIYIAPICKIPWYIFYILKDKFIFLCTVEEGEAQRYLVICPKSYSICFSLFSLFLQGSGGRPLDPIVVQRSWKTPPNLLTQALCLSLGACRRDHLWVFRAPFQLCSANSPISALSGFLVFWGINRCQFWYQLLLPGQEAQLGSEIHPWRNLLYTGPTFPTDESCPPRRVFFWAGFSLPCLIIPLHWALRFWGKASQGLMRWDGVESQLKAVPLHS